jgi:hypothetical protein
VAQYGYYLVTTFIKSCAKIKPKKSRKNAAFEKDLIKTFGKRFYKFLPG